MRDIFEKLVKCMKVKRVDLICVLLYERKGIIVNKISLMGLDIDNVSLEEAILEIDNLINNKKSSYVVTPNVDHVVQLQKDDLFKKIYMNADLVLTDGMPLVWASKILKKPIKEKVSGSDLFLPLCQHAANKGYKVFFLGGLEGVAQKAADIIIQKYPGFKICGVYSPPFGFENDKSENQKIINMINQADPQILFVGVGAPKQEKWIYKNKNKYKQLVSLAIGASFDFVAGTVKRAPVCLQRAGLEWLYRFIKEPRRLFKRYFIDDARFLVIFAKEFVKSLR